MKGPGVLLSIPVLLAGCASMASHGPTNYDDLPGSGDNMAKGPGLFAYGQRDSYEGGYRVFSDDPNKPALVHPPATNGQQANRSGAAAASSGHDTMSANASSGAEPSPQQRSRYQQFEEYQQYQNFQNQPENSPERQKFREWQEWKQYQQWKNGG